MQISPWPIDDRNVAISHARQQNFVHNFIPPTTSFREKEISLEIRRIIVDKRRDLMEK